jgi:hypothetical protein
MLQMEVWHALDSLLTSPYDAFTIPLIISHKLSNCYDIIRASLKSSLLFGAVVLSVVYPQSLVSPPFQGARERLSLHTMIGSRHPALRTGKRLT